MGAIGNTGRRISEQLLEEDENIRALGRSAVKLAGLESKGAEVLTGDATDAALLTSAFRGADTLHLAAASPFNPPHLLSQWLPNVGHGQTVGAGHINQLEAPDQVNLMIENFIRH